MDGQLEGLRDGRMEGNLQDGGALACAQVEHMDPLGVLSHDVLHRLGEEGREGREECRDERGVSHYGTIEL